MPGGRPQTITQSVVNKLETAFALGCTDIEACVYSGISKQTLYNYQAKHEKFLDRKELLKQTPILLARTSVVQNLKKDPNLALKFLERKKKDEFAPKSTLDINNLHYLSDGQVLQRIDMLRQRLALPDPEVVEGEIDE